MLFSFQPEVQTMWNVPSGSAHHARVAHQLRFSDLGREIAFAVVEPLPPVAVGTRREVQAVFAVLREIGEKIVGARRGECTRATRTKCERAHGGIQAEF